MLTPQLYRLTRKDLKNYITDAISLRKVVLNEIEIEYSEHSLMINKAYKASGFINLLDYCGDLIIHKLSFAYTNVHNYKINSSEAIIYLENPSIKL